MSEARVYDIHDPNLPAGLKSIQRIFLEQPRRRGPGFAKAQREAERLRRKKIEEAARKKQTGLL